MDGEYTVSYPLDGEVRQAAVTLTLLGDGMPIPTEERRVGYRVLADARDEGGEPLGRFIIEYAPRLPALREPLPYVLKAACLILSTGRPSDYNTNPPKICINSAGQISELATPG